MLGSVEIIELTVHLFESRLRGFGLLSQLIPISHWAMYTSGTLLLPIAFEWERCRRVKVGWSWAKYEIQRYLIQLDLWTLKPFERSPLDLDLESVYGLINKWKAFGNFRIMIISQKRFNYLIRSTVPDIIQKFFNFFFYAICRKEN